VFEGLRRAWKHHTRLHPETFVCSRRGHVTPASTVARLRPEDAGLGVDLPDGRRLARCLRCDLWVAGALLAQPVHDALPPLAELRLPRRGEELREAIVLRLISIDRGVHAVIFGMLATAVISLELHIGPLRSQAQSLLNGLRATAGQTGQEPSRGFIARELQKLLNVNSHTLLILAFTAVAYCVVEAVEAVGLWHERRWAEYLTALATAGFLPFEVDELIKRVTVFRMSALVINVAILVWLVWKKRLFGIGGGVEALRHEEIDRDALFGAPAG
jgi:uncharacterized membrane protein (DUF2068 family)